MDKVAATTRSTEDTTNKNKNATASLATSPPAAGSCCLKFDARIESFQEKEWKFEKKPFVVDSTWCFFYIPLNFGGAMTRACSKIEAADAAVPDEEFIMLSDMTSRWSTRILLSASKDLVPGAEMVHLSGTFLTKVFEGPYSDFGKWIMEMKAYIRKEKNGEAGIDADKCEMYAYYATCPGCAKKYGKNYTVLFAKVGGLVEFVG
jgi:hypothetical protein